MGRIGLARHRRGSADARPFALPPPARSAAAGPLGKLVAARTLRAQVAALSCVRSPLRPSDAAALVSILRASPGAPLAPPPLGAAAATALLDYAPTELAVLIAQIRARLHAGTADAADIAALAALVSAGAKGTDQVRSLVIPAVAASAARLASAGGQGAEPAVRVLAFCVANGADTELCAAAALSLLRDERASRRTAVAAAVVVVSAYVRDAGAANGGIAAVLERRVLDEHTLSPFARLSLLRAAMEAPAAASAAPALLIVRNGQAGGIFEALCEIATGSADVHLRFRAMDGVIAVLHRVAPDPISEEQRAVVLGLLHERFHEPFPGIAQQMRDALAALLATDGGGESATRFWHNAALGFIDADARVKGLYAPLGTLIRRTRALPLLLDRPRLQDTAIAVIALDSTLGKPVGDFLEHFWRALFADLNYDVNDFHSRAGVPMLAALVHPRNVQLRERAAQHLLPAYFRAADGRHEAVAAALLSALRVPKFAEDARVRGTVAVLSAARKRGVFLASFGDDDTRAMLRAALMSADEDVRCTTLNLLVTCRVSTEPISQSELSLLLEILPAALLPSGSLSEHSQFRHSMRTFFERLRDCWHAAKSGSGGWWMRLRKEEYGGIRTVEFENRRLAFLESIKAFLRQLCCRLLSAIFPGSTFGRRTNALELLDLLVSTLSFSETILEYTGPGIGAQAITGSILACMVDDWERPRVVALNLASKLPRPIPGLESRGHAQMLLDFALPMVCSSRKREVDAGALMCRYVFRSFTSPETCTQEPSRSLVPLPVPRSMRESARMVLGEVGVKRIMEPGSEFADLNYGYNIVHWIEQKISSAEKCFTDACKDGLFHGQVHVLRYVVQDMSWETSNVPTTRVRALSKFCKRLLSLAEKCVKMAIRGIALEGAADVVIDLPDILTDDVRQRVASACFHSVKEVCVLLGLVCHHVPFTGGEEADDDHTIECGGILVLKDIERIGNVLNFVLRSTRHWGVIDGATEGMQLTCETLLRSSSETARSLPKKWVADVIASATRGETYVLRRSAGIPHYVLAVVRAEGATRKSHATPILSTVAKMLLTHVQKVDLYRNIKTMTSKRSKEEESVTHALNLLRALFRDRNLSNSILKFFADTMIAAVQAFGSTSWLIRNSAMTLFSALIRRGVGVPQERKKEAAVSSFDPSAGTAALMDGCRRIKGATALQFFSRYPELYPFLLEHLREAVASFKVVSTSDHPSLFPVLYLLSSLAPSPGGEEQINEIRKAGFSELLEQCLHWRSDYVRRAAATGFISMIESPRDVPNLLRALLREKLPGEPMCVYGRHLGNDVSKVGILESGDEGKEHIVKLRQNQLHGELLRILAVLGGTWRVMGRHVQAKAVKVLSENLPSRLWLAQDDAKNPCSVTRACMVLLLNRVIERAIDFESENEHTTDTATDCVHECIPVLLRMGEETANKCLLVTAKAGQDGGEGSFVGYENLLRASTELACIVLVHSSSRGICSVAQGFGKCFELLNHKSRVVRERAASHATKLLSLCCGPEQGETQPLECHSKDVPGLVQIWNFVVMALRNEREEGVLVQYLVLCKAALSVFKYWSDVCFKGHGAVAKRSIVDVAVSATNFLQGEYCIDVYEHSLSLVGQCIGVLCKLKYSGASSCGRVVDGIVNVWVSHVEDSCDDERCVSTRVGACRSIGQSGFDLSGCCDSSADDTNVHMLLCTLKLLEDDHSDIRKMSADVVSACLPSPNDETYSLDILPAIFAVQQILCRNYGTNRIFVQHLENVLQFEQVLTGTSESCEPAFSAVGLLQTAVGLQPSQSVSFNNGRRRAETECDSESDASEGSDSGRIFSKETANTHSEAVHQMQLAVRSCLMIAKFVQIASGLRAACSIFTEDLMHRLRQVPRGSAGTGLKKEDFESSFAAVARVAAMAVLIPGKERCNLEKSAAMIHSICSDAAIHPALAISAKAVADMLTCDDDDERRRMAAGVLFLL